MTSLVMKGPDFDGFLRLKFKRPLEIGKYLIHEKRSSYLLEVNLPGFIKDDITVHERDRFVYINALKSTISPAPHGSFSLKIKIPRDASQEPLSWYYEASKLYVLILKEDPSSWFDRILRATIRRPHL